MATVVARLNDNDPTLERVSLESTKDFHYGELSKALRKSKHVKSFHINEGIFTVEEFKSPTWRHLKQLLQSVAYMRGLEELRVRGNMTLDNMHDVEVIAKSICKHPELRDVRLLDFVIHARDGGDADPLLEALVTAASSIPTLQTLDLQCQASFRVWNRSYISTSSLAPICQSTILQRLALSNVGLEDEHFSTIARELMNNKDSVLKELILNDNNQTVVGTEAMIDLLDSNNVLESLEMHNHNRIDDAIAKRLLDCVGRNHLVNHVNANIRCKLYRTEINFLLLLNRAGRKKLLNPDIMPTEAIDVLAAANGNVSVLMHFLRENPALCKDPAKFSQMNVSAEAQIYEAESLSRLVKEKEIAGETVVVEEENPAEQVVEEKQGKSATKNDTTAAAADGNVSVLMHSLPEHPALYKEPVETSQKNVSAEAQIYEAESLSRPVKGKEVSDEAVVVDEENTTEQVVEEKQGKSAAKNDTTAAAADGNVSVLMHFLPEHPALYKEPVETSQKNVSAEAQTYEAESLSRPVKEKEIAGEAVVVEEENTAEQVVEEKQGKSAAKNDTTAAAANGNVSVLVHFSCENPALYTDPVEASQKNVCAEAEIYEAESLWRPVKTRSVEKKVMAGEAVVVEEENTSEQVVEEKQEKNVAKDDAIATTGALKTSEGASTVADRNNSEVATKATTGELYSIFRGMADESVIVWRRFWYRSSVPGDASEEA